MSLTLTKIAETNSTITLGWIPVPGAIGYRFTAEKQAKPSHTWDPTRDSVKFSKGSAWYKVEALGVAAVGQYPVIDPPPPPPDGDFGSALPSPLPESIGQIRIVSNASELLSALSQVNPGDRVRLRPGTYPASLRPMQSGTAQAPITLEAESGGVSIVSTGGGRPLRVDAAYWRFRNVRFADSPNFSGANVDVYGHHIEFVGCENDGGRGSCFYSDEGSHHLRFERCHVHLEGQLFGDRQTHGFYLQGDDQAVLGCYGHDIPNGFGVQRYDKGDRAIIAGKTTTQTP